MFSGVLIGALGVALSHRRSRRRLDYNYQTQVGLNDGITNYVDALYFTVTTLTTTGFGDVTLVGTTGKLLAVAIMIFGISLFLRLVQVVLRPAKAHFPCPTCGLRRHDHDAVHCKACGSVLNIPDDGVD